MLEIESSGFVGAGVVRCQNGGRSSGDAIWLATPTPLQGPATTNRLIGKWISA